MMATLPPAFDTHYLQGVRRPGDKRRIVAPPSLTINSEVFGSKRNGIGRLSRALAQQVRSGGAA